MRIARATAGGRTFHAEVAGDELHVLAGDVFAEPRRTGEALPLDEVTLLAPVDPPRIFLMLGGFVPDGETLPPGARPIVTTKVVSHVAGDGSVIGVPPFVTEPLWVEVELGVVIGRGGAIWGYTLFNDVCAPEFIVDRSTMTLLPEPDFFRCKSIDTFAVMGPWVRTDLTEAEIDAGLEMTTRVNGEVKGTGTTRTRKFSPSEVVRTLAEQTPLEPGDVISLGCPAPVDAVAGDAVEIEIDGIGVLRSTLAAAGAAAAALVRSSTSAGG
jgi:2-keto-4-pentenoate hydratase/2-oxohepta-3-ene-1,7-dioic acid hydratase in catechol pathway